MTTREQRMAALSKADEVRIYRANLKRDIKARRTSIYDILSDPPEMIETMHLYDLMMAIPLYGRARISRILRVCYLSPAKPIGELSDRQRAELVFMLKRR